MSLWSISQVHHFLLKLYDYKQTTTVDEKAPDEEQQFQMSQTCIHFIASYMYDRE